MESDVLRRRTPLAALVSTVIHAVGASLFVYTASYNYWHVEVPHDVLPFYSSYGRQFKFLTYWNELVQASYMTWALCIDLCYWLNAVNSTTLANWSRKKDFYQLSIAFPLAAYVSSTFWLIYAVDRELILPSIVDKYYPRWMNQVEHTCVVVFQILEVLTSPRVYPAKHSKALRVLFNFQLAYIIWMIFLLMMTGKWVYPILDELILPFKVLFISFSMAICLVWYFVCHWANVALWGDMKPERSSKND